MATRKEQNETEEKTELKIDKNCQFIETKTHQPDAEQDSHCQKIEESPADVTNHSDENYGRPNIVTYQSDNIGTDDESTEAEDAGTQYQALKDKKCKKNPGHPDFKSVEEFTVKDLPEGLWENDIYELIKATADLTVIINVAKASPFRPKLVPGTTIIYPRSPCTGSGMMHRVWKYTNRVGYQDGYSHLSKHTQCWCRNCEGSESPSKVWWEFDVATATHVVFDDIEASNSSLTLFFDSNSSLTVKVDKVSATFANVQDDWCKLIGVTCDEGLGDKLEKIWETYKGISRRVLNKYKDTRDEIKLTFIVSHPHGFPKHVSVNYWKMKKVDDQFNGFSYTTSTCPGSSGASVHCVGYGRIGWKSTDLIHSGTMRDPMGLLMRSVTGAFF